MSTTDPRSIGDDYHYGSIDYEDLILNAPIPNSLDRDNFSDQILGRKTKQAISNRRYYIANKEHVKEMNRQRNLLHREDDNATRNLKRRLKKLGLE